MRCGAVLFVLVLGLELDDVMRYASELVRRNGVDDQFERGAFLILRTDGLSMMEWPFERRYRTAHWRGTVPQGVVAVIHTHPNEYPHPSSTDRAEARRLALPVFVATRGRLCVATPSNEVSCVSAKPRAELRGVSPAADERVGRVPQMNPE